MRRLLWLPLLALIAACGGNYTLTTNPGPGPGTNAAPAAAQGLRAVGLVVTNRDGVPVAGESCSLQDTPGWTAPVVTDGDGYLVWLTVTSDLRNTAVRCAASVDYLAYEAPAVLQTGANENLPNVAVAAADFDPSSIPLAEIATIRGAMWPKGTAASCGVLPFGPRPGSPDNIIATDFISQYSAEQQNCIIAELKSRGYTHVVVGPFVDSDGYHGLYTPRDWRGANWSAFLDVLQKFWNAHLVPVVFGHPDGWTFEQTRDEFTALLQQPRAQRLIRFFVPHGWEPCKYECSSYTWAMYGQWCRSTLPNAVCALHTVADVDAPVGTDAHGDDNGHPNAEGWIRVAPFFHIWLTQSSAFEAPDAHGDPNHPDKTNFDNWQDNYRCSVSYSYCNRFVNGYAGWPQFSAWGTAPLCLAAGEYSSYWRFWQNRPEAEGVKWGDASVAAGSGVARAFCGYLDSGSASVPTRQ